MPDPWNAFPDEGKPRGGDPWSAFPDDAKTLRRPKRDSRPKPETRVVIGGPPSLKPTGEAHDGDTFRLTDGNNARLLGVDAFEVQQQGRRNGESIPLGMSARDHLLTYAQPGGLVRLTGEQTYGRPVATLDNGGDAGEGLIGSGMALPVPKYLTTDPDRLARYVDEQRDAIADERGAYAGQYQLPAEYRKQGDAAPMRGKIKMTPDQYGQFSTLVRNPHTTPEAVAAWVRSQGHEVANVDNLMAFMRDNPSATPPDYFQQRDVQEQPVLPGGPGFITRQLGALNEGIVDLVGAPVDLVNAGLGALGVPVSDTPIMGSEWIRKGARSIGIGQPDANYQPRSDVERYTQQAARGTGQAILPAGGMISGGLRLGSGAMSTLAASSAPRMAARNALVEAGRRPGVVLAGEGAAGVGSGIGGQVADDQAPGNQLAQVAGQLIGGIGGGIAAGVPVARSSNRVPVGDQFSPDVTPVGGIPALVDQPPAGSGAAGQREALGWLERAAGKQPTPTGFLSQMAGDAQPLKSAGADEFGGVIAPTRQRDLIDVNDRARPMLADPTEAMRAAQAARLEPGDVIPVPANTVASLEEAQAINRGFEVPVRKGDELAELTTRNYPDPKQPGKFIARRGPADLVTWLRSAGGLQPDGELAAIGVDNRPRTGIDFVQNEGRIGDLVSSRGMSLDEAAEAAWEAGYLPQFAERPTPNDLLDVLADTHRGGGNRAFLPEDMDEIRRFEAARGQRSAVEAARQEGAPLVDDRSQPVELADLERNTVPVTAYEEWGENAPNFAGNIRLANLDSPQAIKRALVATDQHVGGFDAARRGRITRAETETLAGELGMTADDLLKRRKGQALNAEEALAARQILAKSANELVLMARKVKSMENPGDEVNAAFRQAWVRHVAIQEQVAGITAEAGRTLAQFRQVADSRLVKGKVLDGLAPLVEGGRGGDRLKAAADMILDSSSDPGLLNAAAARALKPRFQDKLIELWYNSLLSGPTTHVVNVTSNTLTSLAQIPEHAAAAAIGGIVRMIDPKTADRVLFSELGARAVGMMQGAREGFIQAGRTFATGEPSDFTTKVEAQSQKAISGLKGELLRIPTRALAAEDELFKAMARRMELAGLAVRQADSEGLRGATAKSRVAELLANPTDDMLGRAFDYGRYLTFQRPLGPVGQSVSRITQDMPILKLVLPFVRTPTNLLKFTLERSPAAPILREWRDDIKAGGARRDLAAAKAMVGSGAMAMIAEMVSQGFITGGGTADRDAKALQRADGWQPYSVKLGDKYYSYQRLDPFASTLGIAADWADLQSRMTEKQQDDVATLLVASTLKNLSNKTWLSGLTDLTEAINDPDRFSEAFISRLTGSIVVPTGVSQVARTMDPVLREARTPLDRIRSRIPGLSQTLEPQRDVWGKEVRTDGGLGPDIASPIWQSTGKNDPTNGALLAAGIGIPKLKRKVGSRELTGPEYSAYQRIAGEIAKPQIDAVIGGPTWSTMQPDDREDEVKGILRQARKDARGQILAPAADPWASFPDAKSKRRPNDPWAAYPDAAAMN